MVESAKRSEILALLGGNMASNAKLSPNLAFAKDQNVSDFGLAGLQNNSECEAVAHCAFPWVSQACGSLPRAP
jgi:hypothetical protein